LPTLGVATNPLDLLRAALPPEYEIVAHLNRGAQAAVFEGRYNGERAAIKVFAPTADQRRVDREVDALQAIDCDYLVKVRGSTTIAVMGERLPVIAYEFLDGGDLRALLPPAARPAQDALREIAVHVSTALDALWRNSNRVVHRDVKPANIVRSGTRYVLADVGVARHVSLPAITMPGGWAGTPGFMSPEQAMGRRNLTINSDVFSFGVTLYQLASGAHPFNGQQVEIGTVTPAPLSQHRPDLDPEFCRIVDAMMNVVPHRRPTGLTDRFRQL
jgi:serine/threonine protein kinase